MKDLFGGFAALIAGAAMIALGLTLLPQFDTESLTYSKVQALIVFGGAAAITGAWVTVRHWRGQGHGHNR